jgi:hypothetical protein
VADASAARVAERRRTRTPDWLTDAFLVLTAIFAIWGVALVALTFAAIAQPAFFYSDQKSAIKAAGATVVAFLAVSQLVTMESTMGHLPRGGLRVRVLMRAHRWGGRIVLILAALIAFFCMTDLGAPPSPIRGAIHAVLAATAFTAIALKLLLIRFRPRLAYDVAPWLGRYAAVAFVGVWITSAVAYYTGNL